jgi:hypothetical protein
MQAFQVEVTMSPDDIDQVTRTWQEALTRRDLLLRAVGDHLPGAPAFRSARSEWIVRSVTLLSSVLDRPTAFLPAAVELISLRFPVTIEELAIERVALFAALEDRCALDASETRAWNLAIDLFAEIVSSIGLDPFGLPRARRSDVATSWFS